MSDSCSETNAHLKRARRGDSAAVDRLFALYQPRVRRMVAVRLDARPAARVDLADVVQETLAQASRKIDDYRCDQRVSFYPRLRRIAGS